jgi:hypothetical protein
MKVSFSFIVGAVSIIYCKQKPPGGSEDEIFPPDETAEVDLIEDDFVQNDWPAEFDTDSESQNSDEFPNADVLSLEYTNAVNQAVGEAIFRLWNEWRAIESIEVRMNPKDEIETRLKRLQNALNPAQTVLTADNIDRLSTQISNWIEAFENHEGALNSFGSVNENFGQWYERCMASENKLVEAYDALDLENVLKNYLVDTLAWIQAIPDRVYTLVSQLATDQSNLDPLKIFVQESVVYIETTGGIGPDFDRETKFLEIILIQISRLVKNPNLRESIFELHQKITEASQCTEKIQFLIKNDGDDVGILLDSSPNASLNRDEMKEITLNGFDAIEGCSDRSKMFFSPIALRETALFVDMYTERRRLLGFASLP